MANMTRPIAAALAALALAGSAVPNASLRQNKTYEKPTGTVVDSVSDDIRRPIPTEFETGNTYDDLLFFEDEENPSNSKLVSELPEGRRLADDSAFLTYAGTLTSDDVRTVEITDVEGEYFTKALKFDLVKENEELYSTRFSFESPVIGAEEGESAYMHISLHSYNRDIYLFKTSCQIQLILKDESGKKLDSIAGDTADYTLWGYDWLDYYIPFTVPAGFASVEVRLGWTGRYGETASMGGFEVVGYGKDVALEKLPQGVDMASLEKDAAWRAEAWERIEEIRKGDMNVTVVDKNGKPVKDATVDVNMYEANFSFGACVNNQYFTEGYCDNWEHNQRMFSMNFNAATNEGLAQWLQYENDSQGIVDSYKALISVGMNRIRGHALYWDMDPDTNEWTNTPDYAFDLINAGDKEGFLAALKKHIDEVTSALKEYTTEWDVVNEAVDNKYAQKKLGDDILYECFRLARESLGEDGVLYYNDFAINEELFDLLDRLEENGVDYDGIGIQSHTSSQCVRSPEILYDFYDQLAERFGKMLKVTEYTYSIPDEVQQANYTRDLLIAAFSEEAMQGIHCWWTWDGGQYHFPDLPSHFMYDKDWNLKMGGKVWQDLIYNKWWTRETLTSDENGKISLRGFYGDYDVTVTTADGKMKTVSIPLYKDGESNFVIIMD